MTTHHRCRVSGVELHHRWAPPVGRCVISVLLGYRREVDAGRLVRARAVRKDDRVSVPRGVISKEVFDVAILDNAEVVDAQPHRFQERSNRQRVLIEVLVSHDRNNIEQLHDRHLASCRVPARPWLFHHEYPPASGAYNRRPLRGNARLRRKRIGGRADGLDR